MNLSCREQAEVDEEKIWYGLWARHRWWPRRRSLNTEDYCFYVPQRIVQNASGLITIQRMHHEWAWGLKRVVLSPVHSGSDALSGCQLVARRHSGCIGEPLVYLPPGHVSINDILHSLVVSSVWKVITGLIHFTLPAVISPLVAPSCQISFAFRGLWSPCCKIFYKDLVKV